MYTHTSGRLSSSFCFFTYHYHTVVIVYTCTTCHDHGQCQCQGQDQGFYETRNLIKLNPRAILAIEKLNLFTRIAALVS